MVKTASGVNSKVLDDYCWIHSTFHIRTEFQGNVACIVDPQLVYDKSYYTGSSLYYEPLSSTSSMSILPPTKFTNNSTPDTSFYQWVPLFLVLQVTKI